MEDAVGEAVVVVVTQLASIDDAGHRLAESK
jgi:hypothetical protein